MRPDMEKVLTERTRIGGNTRNYHFDQVNRTREQRYVRGVEEDTRPKRVGIRKPYRVSGDYKEFSDHINPLHRFLGKRVGRPWNQVWSEVCKVFKGRGVQAQHIKDHVLRDAGQHPESRPTYYTYRPFYVDAKGYLRRGRYRG